MDYHTKQCLNSSCRPQGMSCNSACSTQSDCGCMAQPACSCQPPVRPCQPPVRPCPSPDCSCQPPVRPCPSPDCSCQPPVRPCPPSGCCCQPCCPGQERGPVEQMQIAMAYVPWQKWKQPYQLDKALYRGTIFPELDLPFTRGRCQ